MRTPFLQSKIGILTFQLLKDCDLLSGFSVHTGFYFKVASLLTYLIQNVLRNKRVVFYFDAVP